MLLSIVKPVEQIHIKEPGSLIHPELSGQLLRISRAHSSTSVVRDTRGNRNWKDYSLKPALKENSLSTAITIVEQHCSYKKNT